MVTSKGAIMAENIDDLVTAAMDAQNPKRLTYVHAEVTEANFGLARPLRTNPTVVTLGDLGLTDWNSHQTVVATIDQKHAQPTMAEVLSYAIHGWDGETAVWFILESGRIGYLCRGGAHRRLSLSVFG